jgi:serine/threonine protein kinase HipA of HipAB toxin-antitoxin module
LLLDALIGNTDRHHENWGVIAARAENAERRLDLAPSYDHASSLGRELSDSRRLTLLRSSGNHGLDAYARRTRSAIYAAGSPQPLSPLAAFERAGEMRRSARAGWLRRLTQVDVEALEGIADRLPPESASGGAVAFAKAFLRYNYRALVALFREDTR